MAALAALEIERALRVDAEAERDRLREAHHALQLEVEFVRRRLVVGMTTAKLPATCSR